MGRRGPVPTPTEVLKMRGSWRADLNRGEPQATPGAPERPDWLTARAAVAWDDLAPMLAEVGVMTLNDGPALALLCETWATWKEATEMIAKHGSVLPTKFSNGEIKGVQTSPYISIARHSGAQLHRLFQEFGLTPSARTRIVTTKGGNDDARTRFLGLAQ